MPSVDSISVEELARLIGTPDCPALVDVRTEAATSADALAASLGLSRMYADDLEQIEAGMALYDAFYRWCRNATDEMHNWPSAKKSGGRE